MEEKLVIPFEAGNAVLTSKEDSRVDIIVTLNGIKYEFDASPAGIEAFSVDGGQVKKYIKK